MTKSGIDRTLEKYGWKKVKYLDTEEKVREARIELEEATEEGLQECIRAARKARELTKDIVFDNYGLRKKYKNLHTYDPNKQ